MRSDGTGERRDPDGSETAAPPLVLVVDDFQDNREMFAEFLEISGYRVAQAASGEEALERAFSLGPDLIVMDLSLPGLDGWEATRRLKGDPRTRDIPVLAVSGHALATNQRGAFEAGCDGFIVKPCPPDKLLAAVEQHLLAARRTSPRDG